MSPLALVASGGFEPPSAYDFWHPLVGDGPFALTRPMILIAFSVLVLAVFFLVTSSRRAMVPGKLQFAAEGVYGFVRNGVALDILGRREFRPYVPMLFTMFTLILVNNVFGIIPFIQYPTFSRIAFPIALTLIVFVVYHAIGIRRRGLGGYFKSLMPAGVPIILAPLVYLLELATYFITRPLTLALRLFANMFAGHMMLLVFALGGEYLLLHTDSVVLQAASIGSFLMFILMTFFELLVQALQAYVFVLLAAFYIAGSLEDAH